jgi:two-component system phosphate regulon sensor histidine kinase PhoR
MIRRLHWRIALPYLALILTATLGLTIYISNQVRQITLSDLENQLLAEARLLADNLVSMHQGKFNIDILDNFVQRTSALLAARVTIIATDGVVLGESHEDRTVMDNHLNRPEVQQALKTGKGSMIRYSATLGYEMMYVAVPILAEDGQNLGVARVALPLGEIDANVNRLRKNIVLAGFVIALTAALLAVYVARRTTQPLRKLTTAAESMASGNLDTRLLTTSRDEVAQLTRAFNYMADQVRTQVNNLAEERGRLAAVLDHMADGVLITNHNGQVKLINTSAARLLHTSEERALDRSLGQVAPYYPLIDLWKACQEQGVEQVSMVEVSHHNLFLQAIITPFQEVGAEGYLIILQDLTRIRRLETIRRDFISNISHELRTPLAGLKALVETLLGGALKDRTANKRFLKRMDTEVDTLTQIVEELLELSRIESGQVPLQLVPTPISEIVIPPVDRLRPQAERAGLELIIQLPSEIPPVLADVERVQLVLTNIVHNSIKFTLPGGRIEVSVHFRGDDAIFSVQDTGVGIPAEDLPRIFERFYKADRARSGGGTGLGLAIAKHIVQGHNGRIWAESIEGKGTTVYFTLPISAES